MAGQMKEKRGTDLTIAIFIGLILGAVTGVLLYYVVLAGPVRDSVAIDNIFYVVENDFLRLMQMLTVPLIFCSLVCGSMTMGDTKKLGRIRVETLGFYPMTTALAIAAAIPTTNVIDPGKRLDMTSIGAADVVIRECANLADTLLAIIPTDPLHTLVSDDMLPVIPFALFVGVILVGPGESGETVGDFSSQFNDVMVQMIVIVVKLAPYGVFCLTARTSSGIGFDALVPLLKYITGVMIVLTIQCLVVYMMILRVLTGLSPSRFLKRFLPVVGFVFSTATSNATIPMFIDTLYRKTGAAKQVSSFTIPLGATINMDGTAIMQGVVAAFASQAFGIRLAMADYPIIILAATLMSIGTVGVPGMGLIALSMVFASVGLPVEAIALVMGIGRVLDMGRTTASVTGDAVHTTIVASQDRATDREMFNDPETEAGMEK